MDIYKLIGWIAMLVTPLSPSIFFGWKAYQSASKSTGATWLALLAGVATAAGLELVGVLAGHTAIEYHQRKDKRWIFAAIIMATYVIIGTVELWTNSIGRVTFLIAALVYLLVGLRHGLETAVAAEEATRHDETHFKRQLQLREAEWKHQERLARIQQKRQNSAATLRQDNGTISGNLPADWRQLTDTQRHELAHLPRVERESIMPPIADRTRRIWHERLDEIAAQNGSAK